MKCDFGAATIEGPFPFVAINKIELSANINEHVRTMIWGILERQSATDAIMFNHKDAIIKITLSDGNVFFIGLPLEVEVEEQNGLFQTRITCVSTSYLLDIYPHKCSYQDISLNYADIIKIAYSQEKGSFSRAGKDAYVPIKVPVFQYNETEWEFTLRMANKLMTYVIADYRTECPGSVIGQIEGQTISLDKTPFISGYTQEKGYFYSCKLSEQLRLGDIVIIQGRKMLVVKVYSVFMDGEFVNTYVFGTKEGYSVKHHKLSLSGYRLRGSVLDTDGERVKIHLDIDKEQNVDKAYWFKFMPQTGNAMYCMPQVGTKVMLRFCSNRENSAIVEECWRENGQTCPEIVDYNNRYFTTEFGKRMAMLQETIFLEGDENQVKLSDSLGIFLQSRSYTRIVGKEGISIMADKKIRLKVPRHIYITKLNTQSIVDFAGNDINIESANTNIVTMQDMTFDKTYPTCETVPAMTINRRLAGKVLGFVPKKSGRGIV